MIKREWYNEILEITYADPMNAISDMKGQIWWSFYLPIGISYQRKTLSQKISYTQMLYFLDYKRGLQVYKIRKKWWKIKKKKQNILWMIIKCITLWFQIEGGPHGVSLEGKSEDS